MAMIEIEGVQGVHPGAEWENAVVWQRKQEVFLWALLAVFYVICAVMRYSQHPLTGGNHFIYLADGWLHGHFYLHAVPANTGDYTFFQGHWYVAFPPLPAIFLLPVVAIFHLSHQGIIGLTFSVGIGMLNIWLMLCVLKRFAQKYVPEMRFAEAVWIVVLFALGTEHFYATLQGNVWYTAHIVATTFLLLSIYEALDRQRPVVAGCYLGLAALSRATTLYVFPFFVLLVIGSYVVQRQEKTETEKQQLVVGVLRRLVPFFVVLVCFLGGMLLYNWVRFGSLLDFGYNTMNVNAFVRGNLHTYGQFNVHFLGTNAYYMLLRPPILLSHFPYLTFDPLGTSIFLTMPPLILAFLAFRHKKQRWIAGSLVATCLLPTVFLLLYFNTGWYQFGYRFVLDILPFVLLLTVLGMRSVPPWLRNGLIILAVGINMWGFWVFSVLPLHK